MSIARSLAAKLLRAARRLSSPDGKEWAEAMLRELDFIEGDWAAFFWAIGSMTAIFRRSGRGWISRSIKRSQSEKEQNMKDLGKNVAGVLLGIGVAALFAICVVGIHQLATNLFPVLTEQKTLWITWVFAMLIPEMILIASIVKLWGKRRPMAVGLLLSALLIGTHIVMHIASHWKG